GIDRDGAAAGLDALVGQGRATGVSGGKFGQVERGASELPGGLDAVGFLAPTGFGLLIETLRTRRDRGDSDLGRSRPGSSKLKAQSPKENPGSKEQAPTRPAGLSFP